MDLSFGDKTPASGAWERFLADQKIYTGAIDNDFGPLLRQATKDFQTKVGLPVTGIVDGATYAAAEKLGFERVTNPAIPSVTHPDGMDLLHAPVALPPGLDPLAIVRKAPFLQAAVCTRGRWRGGKPVSIRGICLHIMVNSEKPDAAEGVAGWFHGPSHPMASASWCTDCDSAVQCVKDEDQAAHAPGVNADMIGIEHAGVPQTRVQWLDDFSLRNLWVSAAVSAIAVRKYDIPLVWLSPDDLLDVTKKGFTCHSDVTEAGKLARARNLTTNPFFGSHTDHSDPGVDFPKDVYFDMIRALLPLV